MNKFLVFAAVCSLALAAACSKADIAGTSANSSNAAAPKPAQTAVATDAKPNPAEAVKFSVEKVAIEVGGTAEADLQLNIAEPFHVNSNPPSEKSYIPLEVEFENQNGFAIGKPIYPKGTPKNFAFSPDKPLSVYDGAITIKLPLTREPVASVGDKNLTGKLKFQACDNEVCYRPQTVPITIPVFVNWK